MAILKQTKEIQDKLESLLVPTNEKQAIDIETLILNSKIMDQLDTYLKEHDIKRTELAKMIGVSRSYLSQLFSCNKIINLSTLVNIRRKLDLYIHIKLASHIDLTSQRWIDYKPPTRIIEPNVFNENDDEPIQLMREC